eukprot:TRINITY_DN11973_c0_g1_i5.p1 TRINITY_DN11973_c0_g1~~TRINITY_DN11973_c0_g1_i5.p1  ORF type:complete len:299 (+),score=55.18 TRINITY_DN11973_c0_g1_i5:80-976(+)
MDYLGELFDISSWKSTIVKHPVKGGLALFGFLAISKGVCDCVRVVYKHFLRPARILQERYGNCWAVITDVSDVVGAAYAVVLGKKFNLLILHEMNSTVDQEIVMKIRQLGSKVATMAVNYGEGYGSESLKEIQGFLADKQVGLIIINQLNLVRNPALSKKSSASEKNLFFQESIIFPLLLLRYLTPMMLRRDKRGAIIAFSHQHISRTSSGLYEIMAKAFTEAFLRSLGAEYKGRLDAVHFEVGSVLGLKRVIPMPFFALAPNAAVKAQLATVGYEKKGSGHWKHCLEKYVSSKCFYL